MRKINPQLTLVLIFNQMNDRVEELITEQCLADTLYLTENDGRLRLDNMSL